MKKNSKALAKCIATFVMTASMVLGTIPFSSAAAEPEGFRWLGRDGSANVDTGLGNGTGTGWWVATDKNDEGTSKLILSGNTDPIEHGADISDEDVKKSGGISGTATLGEGYDYPYIYIGFNIVGVDSETNKAVVTDVTDWGGISIAYESDKKIALEISMGDDRDKDELWFDCPKVTLDKTDGECKVASFAWKQFKQGGWGKEKPIEEVVQSLATIRIKIEGRAGTECNFKIIAIGSKDADLSGNYKVTFDTKGGSTVAAQSVKPGEKATKPAAPTKSGYSFAGWYKDSSLTTPFNFASPITEDTVVYAAWNNGSVPTSYSVTFDTDGGSEVAAQNIMSGSTVAKPADPTKSGKIFAGWYKDSALNTPFDFNTPITQDTTIYAKWSDIVYYMVNFNTNGGSFIPGQSIKIGTKAAKPQDPVKEGFVFGGWYKDSTFKTAFDFSSPINANTILYAKWTDKSATPEPTKASGSAALSLNKSSDSIICGKTDTLKATLKGATGKITWTTSDKNVATVDSNGKVTAKMAGTATITAAAAGKKAACTVTVLYKDVTKTKDFWFAPTNYLTAAGVVKGYDKQTKFKPANDCTRAQMVTFLYRLQGEPGIKSSTCKFTDVKKTDYFYKPVIWAVENGITTGVSKTKFNPQGVCTRAQTVTFLWRMAEKPAPKTTKNKFKDIKEKDYFYKAVLWASEKKIVAGYSDGTFKPQGKCLRRQMVTFLYKYDKYINKKG
ncbi:MAG: InlB B-repeat-containing protein [Clostridiales bacterium]|nr:InlB B-repeat-containing protein [Clostridiales bacterium]